MAYGRRYWRRYYRRYYRNRYNSVSKLRTTRNFKASSANMTQGGTFNVSTIQPAEATFDGTKSYALKTNFDVADWIYKSNMHKALSNVFDQYRIEKISLKIRMLGDNVNPSVLTQPAIIFSAVDRSGFNENIALDELRTYGSYKETMISGAKDVSPVHYVNIGQSNFIEFTNYYDSKNKAAFPSLAIGVNFAANQSNGYKVNLSIEVDAQIRYRGVRLDTKAIQV